MSLNINLTLSKLQICCQRKLILQNNILDNFKIIVRKRILKCVISTTGLIKWPSMYIFIIIRAIFLFTYFYQLLYKIYILYLT